MKVRTLLFSLGLSVALSVNAYSQQAASAPRPVPAVSVRSESYHRTELYMGMSIPGGGTVSDTAWEQFLSEVVTPLFPDGFTVLGGRGQYREASGTIAKEPSHVLVFLYRKADRKSAGAKIETIRGEYKMRFSQESVLRVDITKSVKVSF